MIEMMTIRTFAGKTKAPRYLASALSEWFTNYFFFAFFFAFFLAFLAFLATVL